MIHKNWTELIRPKRLEVDPDSHTPTYGKFACEPLERGFGTTLGNALRRVLLSSLRGAAITGVNIQDVHHEFSAIPGILEDVTEILLNLKQVRLKFITDGVKTLHLEAKGEGSVKAGDIQTDGTVEILNPEQPIATLSSDGQLLMELSARSGKGYVSGEGNKDENQPIGFIPLDAAFSPIRKVNYVVTQARVGQRTDYDKLTLFINFEEEPEKMEERAEEQPAILNEHLYRGVNELELSVRAANCLRNANIRWIGELVQKSEQEMLKTKNFGRKSLNEIKEILTEMGLQLGMKLDSFTPPEQMPERKEERA